MTVWPAEMVTFFGVKAKSTIVTWALAVTVSFVQTTAGPAREVDGELVEAIEPLDVDEEDADDVRGVEVDVPVVLGIKT